MCGIFQSKLSTPIQEWNGEMQDQILQSGPVESFSDLPLQKQDGAHKHLNLYNSKAEEPSLIHKIFPHCF